MKVKIIGAGSIGNHLAQAARRMGWNVSVVDQNPEALRRMREEIYPTRYGSWDEEIKLYTSEEEPRGGFDIICIGTPPHVRMPLARKALEEKPKVLQLEKPLCTPMLDGLKEFLDTHALSGTTSVIVGYDHAVSPSINYVTALLARKAIGEVVTIDVEFREHWKGIFNAHPWLEGPHDSYLGFTSKGGGASGEHSHALHLWQYLAQCSGFGAWTEMSPMLKMESHGHGKYDSIAAFTFRTDTGKVGRVVQDVVTLPSKKWARVQGEKGYIEWTCNGSPSGDLVHFMTEGEELEEKVFSKKRPDDFFAEMQHIDDLIGGRADSSASPISLQSAVSVMAVLNAAYAAQNSGAYIEIKKL